ncbi:MAG TPA: NAD(P)H-hydrate epimerase [Nitrosopumilaceae archaeon]|nr:NAD(P)H-hydrate epimerase [Nitrosopumilaceae archaeon]
MEITVKQMMQIEENGHKMGFLRKFMMENAGAAAVRCLVDKVGNVSSKKILVFAGLGNNGGDALVISRHLAGYGAVVTLVLLGSQDKIKTEESRWNWQLLEKMRSVRLITGDATQYPFDADVIVDGILGTGIAGTIREPYASAISFINKSKALKLAVDVPSGLDPDTGSTANICVKADITVTFHKMKVGMSKRNDMCGQIFVEKIGIPPEAEVGVL